MTKVRIRHFLEEHHTDWFHGLDFLRVYHTKLKQENPSLPPFSHWVGVLQNLYSDDGSISLMYINEEVKGIAITANCIDFHVHGNVDAIYGLVSDSHTLRFFRDICRFRKETFSTHTIVYTKHSGGNHLIKTIQI